MTTYLSRLLIPLTLGLALAMALNFILSRPLAPAVQAADAVHQISEPSGERIPVSSQSRTAGAVAIPSSGLHLTHPVHSDRTHSLPFTNSEASDVEAARVRETMFQWPLQFVPNQGQTDPDVRFLVKSLGGTLFFTP